MMLVRDAESVVREGSKRARLRCHVGIRYICLLCLSRRRELVILMS